MLDNLPGSFIQAYDEAQPPTRAMVDLSLKRYQTRYYVSTGVEVLGVLSGLAVALIVLFVSASLIRGGFAVAGTILGSVDIVGLAGIFVTRQWMNSRSDSSPPEGAA